MGAGLSTWTYSRLDSLGIKIMQCTPLVIPIRAKIPLFLTDTLQGYAGCGMGTELS
jgi:hypothetical protein